MAGVLGLLTAVTCEVVPGRRLRTARMQSLPCWGRVEAWRLYQEALARLEIALKE